MFPILGNRYYKHVAIPDCYPRLPTSLVSMWILHIPWIGHNSGLFIPFEQLEIGTIQAANPIYSKRAQEDSAVISYERLSDEKAMIKHILHEKERGGAVNEKIKMMVGILRCTYSMWRIVLVPIARTYRAKSANAIMPSIQFVTMILVQEQL